MTERPAPMLLSKAQRRWPARSRSRRS